MDGKETLQLTAKQILILFFIETEFANTAYSLVNHLDRSEFFPADLSKNMPVLFEHGLIKVVGYLDNGSPFKYAITEQGVRYLDEHLQNTELMRFADGYSNRELMMGVISGLVKEQTSDRRIEF